MSKDDNKEYRGPGRFTAAVGRADVQATAVGLAATPFTFKAGTEIAKDFMQAEKAVPGVGIGKHVAIIGAAAAATTAAYVHGAYKGWTNASKAKSDHDGLVATTTKFADREELRRDVSEAVGRSK